jgi:diguanylate cyclase (GGDEF)-like protein
MKVFSQLSSIKKHKPVHMHVFLFLFLLFSIAHQDVMAQVFLPDLSYLDSIKSKNFEKFESELSLLEESKHKFQKDEADYFLFLKAYALTFKGINHESLALLSPLLEVDDNPALSFRAKALAVNTLLLSRRYLDAFTYLEQLIVMLPNIEQPMAREQGIRVISMMYNLIGRHDLAMSYVEQLINEKPSVSAVCAAHQLRSEALYFSGRSKEFNSKSAEGLNYCSEQNELLWANLIVALQARSLIEQKKYEEAVALLTSRYQYAADSRYERLLHEFNAPLAQAYYGMGQITEAKTHALIVHGAIKQETLDQPKVEALALLYQIAKTEKNYQQALEYHEQYMAAFTAYMDDKSAQQMAYHTAHSEILAQNQKISLLDKDNRLLQLEQEALKHQAAFNKLLIAALVALVLGLAFLAYRSFIARQRFKALAEYDDLTAISNRYHFSASAKEALTLCEKGQLPAALIVFDLDHFKQINDQYGHAAGDWALRQTVDTCRNFMRNNDVFGRIGGEEFAILLPGCQSDKAHLLADICRDAIYSVDTAASGYEFKLSASFGVTSAEISGYDLTKLIDDADTAMYQAKQLGRNRVHFFQG